ncbi:RteC domain-containing protein [Salinimicrobium sp. CAU 1759]
MEEVLIKEDFEKKIREIEQSGQKKMMIYIEIITFCQHVLELYRKGIREKGFSDTSAEIRFFKEQKQLPAAIMVYYFHLQAFEMEYSRVGEALQRKFLVKKIDDINSFYLANLDFIQYVELDHNYLDEFYFTRKFQDKNLPSKNTFYYRDPDFSTSHDLIFSEIKAYQLLLVFLQSRLRDLDVLPAKNLQKESGLQWTASKVALTELIYALHQSGAINGGSCSLKDLIKAFEDFFSTDTGDYHHTFLRLRERNNPVKFIDRLKSQLLDKMQDLDN